MFLLISPQNICCRHSLEVPQHFCGEIRKISETSWLKIMPYQEHMGSDKGYMGSAGPGLRNNCIKSKLLSQKVWKKRSSKF